MAYCLITLFFCSITPKRLVPSVKKKTPTFAILVFHFAFLLSQICPFLLLFYPVFPWPLALKLHSYCWTGWTTTTKIKFLQQVWKTACFIEERCKKARRAWEGKMWRNSALVKPEWSMKSNLAPETSRIDGEKYMSSLKLKISDGTGGTEAGCPVDLQLASENSMK